MTIDKKIPVLLTGVAVFALIGKKNFNMSAEYTPSQSLNDYTPEQLATSSTITGDFDQDAFKYSTSRYAAESDAAKLKKYEKPLRAVVKLAVQHPLHSMTWGR